MICVMTIAIHVLSFVNNNVNIVQIYLDKNHEICDANWLRNCKMKGKPRPHLDIWCADWLRYGKWRKQTYPIPRRSSWLVEKRETTPSTTHQRLWLVKLNLTPPPLSHRTVSFYLVCWRWLQSRSSITNTPSRRRSSSLRPSSASSRRRWRGSSRTGGDSEVDSDDSETCAITARGDKVLKEKPL